MTPLSSSENLSSEIMMKELNYEVMEFWGSVSCNIQQKENVRLQFLRKISRNFENI